MSNSSYLRAEKFLPWNLQNIVFNTTIFAYWSTYAIYYFQVSEKNQFLIKIEINTGKKETVFNFQTLLNELSKIEENLINRTDLPLEKFSIQENPLRLYFQYDGYNWHYNILENSLIKEKKLASHYLESPNKEWLLYTQNFDLFVISSDMKNKYQLTNDGQRYYDYASSPETNTRAITYQRNNIRIPPIAVWSHNSKKVLTHKLDQRNVDSIYLLQNSPANSKRPKLFDYRMSFSGDLHFPLSELIIIDIETKKLVPIQIESIPCPYLTPIEFKWVWWSNDNKSIYYIQETRASKKLILSVADANTGESKILISENSRTYIEPSQHFLWPHQVLILEETNEIIWLSEQSGYSHLYLFDKGQNTPKHRITQGKWCVREVHFYKKEINRIFFSATGYNNIDPYYKQLFSCRLDGSDIQCLTSENAHHSTNFSPDKNYFLDTYSTINTPPTTVLKSLEGELICCIEIANIQKLFDLNWIQPKRISVKARDQVTNIYGNLFFPSNFDPNLKYPIIDHIYPGPQVFRTQPNFNIYGAIFRSAWTAQALAELGFIVIQIDGFGTPGRSKAFHDFTYGNIGDCGIPDHVAAIKQLAEKHHFIDLENVGITGYSAGGYATVRAMLTYPNFYKVGVAAGGNHDLRCYPASYGEKYNGLDNKNYEKQSNAALANNLNGKLLLIHGEMDDNVHPCATLQLVDALIQHNKQFDMLIMPNQNHRSTFDHPYYIRRNWDYFVQHLLEQKPPKDYFITPMPSEFTQLEDW